MSCRTPWVTCLWPGLPRLWAQGSWFALAVAVVSSALLNVALLSTFVFSELFPADWVGVLWAAVAMGWPIAAIVAILGMRKQSIGFETEATAGEDQFAAAVEYYLKGDWFEVERLLGGLLRKNARDVEGRLMLASLLRRTGRWDEATEELDRLSRFEGAGKWELEIRQQRELLETGRQKAAAGPAQAASRESDGGLTETKWPEGPPEMLAAA